ncbi:MAG: (2Fe-2S)-binding protein [Blautia massiliensis (ex Durand et al. 2017)]|uniref:(2Fe-2S)-binding protein n=1 Tax=Blautia massiliensis (ex Durand et al. 2017) TaxID=1737424 RepID=UPI00399C9FE2
MIKKTLKINGVERILILDKDETLAQVLRNHLLLTGCKIGCGEGHCGACNVIMNGKVTRSCIYKMSRVRTMQRSQLSRVWEQFLTCIRSRLHGWHMDVHSVVSVHQVSLFQQKFFSIIIRALPVKK